MKTKHNTTSGPLVMRLLLATTFLPIVLATLILAYVSLTAESLTINVQDYTAFRFFGLPLYAVIFVAVVVIPIGCLLLIVWKGRWRVMLITLGVLLFFGMFVMSERFLRVAPESRMIQLTRGIPEGADVYCNGVLLGQTPMSISVRDLKAKVPEWTTPPEQERYHYGSVPVYTWLPWDRFERDRYEQHRSLDKNDKKAVLKYDAAAKYWWKIEHNDMNYEFHVIPDEYTRLRGKTFDHVLSYPMGNMATIRTPSENELLTVLSLSYDQLSEDEKDLWCEYVCSLPADFYFSLTLPADPDGKDRNRERYEKMMERIARTKYRFSENPDRAECRRILETVIAENKKTRGTFFDSSISGYGCGSAGSVSQGLLASYAVGQLGDNALEPTQEMLHRHWYGDTSATVLLLMSADRFDSPELFEDKVRFYAMNGCTISSVFESSDDRVLPLFRTVMHSESLVQRFNAKRGIPDKISAMAYIGNPRLEPLIRDEIATITAGRYSVGIETELRTFVMYRITNDEKECRELYDWIQSLRISPMVKQNVLDYYSTVFAKFRDGKQESGPTLTTGITSEIAEQGVIIRIKNPDDEDKTVTVTTTALRQWLEEHPDQEIADYFEAYAAELPHDVNVTTLSLGKLAFDSSPEAGRILKRYWGDPETKETLLTALREIFEKRRAFMENVARTYGETWQMSRNPPNHMFPNSVLVEIFDDVQDVPLCRKFTESVWGRYSPGLLDLIEKWSESDDEILKTQAAVLLPSLRKQEIMHTQSRELFLQIAKGEMSPDELLPASQPWIWQDGKYVQKP